MEHIGNAGIPKEYEGFIEVYDSDKLYKTVFPQNSLSEQNFRINKFTYKAQLRRKLKSLYGHINSFVIEVEEGEVSVAGEMYSMSDEIFQRVKNGEPSGLYFGDVKLNNGSTVKGVLFPRETAESNYKDISNFGDWRAYIASLKK